MKRCQPETLATYLAFLETLNNGWKFNWIVTLASHIFDCAQQLSWLLYIRRPVFQTVTQRSQA
jgi:hypothetical protein